MKPEGGYNGDVRKGFVYKRALHVMLSTVANCEEIEPGMSYEESGGHSQIRGFRSAVRSTA